eukprot:3140822-Rhodomonas_salina.1
MGKIVAASGRNLRKAMLMLESCHVKAGADPITDQVSTSLSCSPDPDSSQHRTAALSLSSCGDISLEEGGGQVEVSPADWETFIAVIAQNILEEQTPKRLLEIRCPGTCLPPP